MSDSATPWTAAHQASLSITNSRSLPKLNLSLKDTANQTPLFAAHSEEEAGTRLHMGVEAGGVPEFWEALRTDSGQLTPGSDSWTRRPDAGSANTALGNSPCGSQLSSCRCSLENIPETTQEPLSWVRGTLPSSPPHPQPPPTPFHPRSHSRQLQQMLSLLLPGPGNPPDQLWASLPQPQGALLLRAHICNLLQGFLSSC